MSGNKRIALVAVVGLALVFAASASATLDASFTAHTAAVAGDCNGNGVSDFAEASWSNRDDDGDGFCNSIDQCPAEASTVNNSSACQLQAVTVPAKPGDPAAPHVTYSGASITLKGVARYGGNQFMWDFGDGSTTGWLAFPDPYNLGVHHTYLGAAGTLYTATLSVRNSAAPSVVATASYPVEIEDAGSSSQNLTAAQFDVRRRMAIDDGLWYLHNSLLRAMYADGAPGYRQSYGYWNTDPHIDCLAIDAFEQNGSTPAGRVATDPYVEDVQRGLARILVSMSAVGISNQFYGNPDTNGNGRGIVVTGSAAQALQTGRCLSALADSGAGDRQAATGGANVGGLTYSAIGQDMADWIAWAQEDFGSARGGWGYYANSGSANDEMERWVVLGLGAAESSLGVTVPAFVRQQMPYWLYTVRATALSDQNGSSGDFAAYDLPTVAFSAAGMIGDAFTGNPASYPRTQQSEGYVYRHWNDNDGTWKTNLGDSDAMYTVMRAMTGASPPQALLKNYDYTSNVQVPGGFDWFRTAAGQSQQGIGSNLLARQASNGSWTDSTGIGGGYTVGTVPDTALDVAILLNGTVNAAPQPPVAQIVSPNQVVSGPLPRTVLLDASRSYDPQGRPLTFSWTVDDGGTLQNATSAVASRVVAHYGSFNATVTVDNGLLSSAATAHVQVVDTTAPSFTSPPQNITLQAGPTTTADVNAWLAAVTAVDDDPDHPSVTLANDFIPNAGSGGVGAGNTVRVTWTATDSVGNAAQASATVTVVGDSTPPTVTPVVTGTLGDNGWYTSDVHLSWQILDPESAIASRAGCADADVTTDTNTAGLTFSCAATSDGGTSALSTITIKRDATPPTITAVRSPAANAAGWSADDVTVTYSCDDDLSGVAQCSAPTVLHEGAGQSAAGTARDNAGNTAAATLTGVNVDKTGPSLAGSPATAPNVSGWYSGDVPVHWTCSDALSGVDGCPPDSAITGEGSGLTAAASVADRAGNVTPALSSPSVRIDRTRPVTIASAPSGWSNAGVTVALSATDNLSGVAVTYYSLDGGPTAYGNSVAIDTEGVHTLTYWSVDAAGNVEATKSVTVQIDRSAPTITHSLSPSPNAAGWNNTDVAVSFTCGDALSGIASCTALQILTGEGANQHVAGHARDNAGNTADDSATVSIDKTAPSVTASADRAANAAGWYDADVIVSFACGDGLSGVATCPAARTVKEGAAQSVAGSATDVAGNAGSASLGGLNVDETSPTVTYAGNAGTYSIAQVVSITCSASDALSGVASTTCADISGPAASFGLGTTSRSASATDRAGNVGTGSVSFTVTVGCDAVKSLIGQWVSSAGVASSLSAKVDAICAAPNATAKSGKLAAFDNEIGAQTGKALTKEHADLLEQYAGAL